VRLQRQLSSTGYWHYQHKVNVGDVKVGLEVEASTDPKALLTPVVVDHEGRIVDGGDRVLLAREKGIKEIPAYVPAHYLYSEFKREEGDSGAGDGTLMIDAKAGFEGRRVKKGFEPYAGFVSELLSRVGLC